MSQCPAFGPFGFCAKVDSMFFTFANLIALLTSYKYFLLFPLAVIEGPIVTVLAAFLASLGYMDIWVVYALIVFSDVVGDLLYYSMGRWGGKNFLQRWGKYLGVEMRHLERLKTHFKDHSRKTLILGKLTHVFGVVVLTAAGVAEVPVGRFVLYSLLPTLPKSLFFLWLGFYFGQEYSQINSYLDTMMLVGMALLILPFTVFFIPKILARFFPQET